MSRLLAFAIATVWLAGCTTHTSRQGQPIVVVTIPPQQYFVDYLAWDFCKVHVMVPPGSSHESYEPKPSDIQQLEYAVAYLRMGPIGFELTWMKRLQSMYPNMAVYDLSHGIAIEGHDHGHEHHHGHHGCSDPHYWMSPRASLIMSDNIREALIDLFPSMEDSITARYQRLSRELMDLDATIAGILAPLENRHFAIFHPVLAYFASDYDLIQLAMEEDGKEPTPARLKQIIQTMKENQVPLILIQREFNTEHAKLVGQSTGASVEVIDPLSINWKEELLHIAKVLARGKE